MSYGLIKTKGAIVGAMMACVMIVYLGSIACGAEINDISWNVESLQTLRTFDKPAVADFISSTSYSPIKTTPNAIGDLAWVDLAGDGRLELLVALDVNGRRFFNALVIFWRDPSGKVTFQAIGGWLIGNLRNITKDLNGSGRKELIVPTELPPGNWTPTFGTPAWPEIYRLKDGQYVEASNEFPSFYERDVLPQIEGEIDKARRKASSGVQNRYGIALLVLTKGQILHVLRRGLTPTEYAETRQANEELALHAAHLRENRQ